MYMYTSIQFFTLRTRVGTCLQQISYLFVNTLYLHFKHILNFIYILQPCIQCDSHLFIVLSLPLSPSPPLSLSLSLSFPPSLSLSPRFLLQLSFPLVLTSTMVLAQPVRAGSRSLSQAEWGRDGKELMLSSVISRCSSTSPVMTFTSLRSLLLTSLILGKKRMIHIASTMAFLGNLY